MNRTKASYQYQLRESVPSVLWYYGIVVGIILLLVIITSIFGHAGTVGSFQGSTVIFLFVVGLSSFKEFFYMANQNGISRKTFYIAKIGCFATLALLMQAADRLVSTIFVTVAPSVLHKSEPFLQQIYWGSGLWYEITMFVFAVVINLLILVVGFAITLLFFRLPRFWRALVGAGVPILLLIVLPVVDSIYFNFAIMTFFKNFFSVALGLLTNSPWTAILTSVITILLFLILSGLMLRKAEVKKD